MARRPNDFAQDDKIKVLLWCDRHCCLCGTSVGARIEVAHIDSKKSNIEEAIPLCFDCHAEIGHYNREHPRGKKYDARELKTRRDQIYDQYTSHLVPPVHYQLVQGNRKLPSVGFEIANLGDVYPIRARVAIRLFRGSRDLGLISSSHYNGEYLWNLNPRRRVNGHFRINQDILNENEIQQDILNEIQNDQRTSLGAEVNITLIDIYDREHKLLPVGFIHKLGPTDDWYFEPSPEELRQP